MLRYIALILFLAYVLMLEECNSAMAPRCYLPKESGRRSCGRGQKYYYYNHKRGRCTSFRYYGCDGNENRFRKRQDCQFACACSAGLEHGKHCGDNTKPKLRYYWDAQSGMCRQFWFVGCKGNHNRFESKSRCKKVCRGNA